MIISLSVYEYDWQDAVKRFAGVLLTGLLLPEQMH